MALNKNKYLNLDQILGLNANSGPNLAQNLQGQSDIAADQFNKEKQDLIAQTNLNIPFGEVPKDENHQDIINQIGSSPEAMQRARDLANFSYDGPKQANLNTADLQRNDQVASLLGGNSSQRKVAQKELGGSGSLLDDVLFTNSPNQQTAAINAKQQTSSILGANKGANEALNNKIGSLNVGAEQFKNQYRDSIGKAYNQVTGQSEDDVVKYNKQRQDYINNYSRVLNRLAARDGLETQDIDFLKLGNLNPAMLARLSADNPAFKNKTRVGWQGGQDRQASEAAIDEMYQTLSSNIPPELRRFLAQDKASYRMGTVYDTSGNPIADTQWGQDREHDLWRELNTPGLRPRDYNVTDFFSGDTQKGLTTIDDILGLNNKKNISGDNSSAITPERLNELMSQNPADAYLKMIADRYKAQDDGFGGGTYNGDTQGGTVQIDYSTVGDSQPQNAVRPIENKQSNGKLPTIAPNFKDAYNNQTDEQKKKALDFILGLNREEKMKPMGRR